MSGGVAGSVGPPDPADKAFPGRRGRRWPVAVLSQIATKAFLVLNVFGALVLPIMADLGQNPRCRLSPYSNQRNRRLKESENSKGIWQMNPRSLGIPLLAAIGLTRVAATPASAIGRAGSPGQDVVLFHPGQSFLEWSLTQGEHDGAVSSSRARPSRSASPFPQAIPSGAFVTCRSSSPWSLTRAPAISSPSRSRQATGRLAAFSTTQNRGF